MYWFRLFIAPCVPAISLCLQFTLTLKKVIKWKWKKIANPCWHWHRQLRNCAYYYIHLMMFMEWNWVGGPHLQYNQS